MKYLVFLVIFYLLLFAPSQTHAFIVQGNSYSNSTSTTTIQGSGSVTTHIESTVNGKTKTLDSNTPGVHMLENSSDVNIKSTATPSATPTTMPTASPQHKAKQKAPQTVVFVGKLQTIFHETIQKLLSIFHL